MTNPLSGHTRLASLPDDPWEFFAACYERAIAAAEVQYPGAMCLSTVSADGRPQGRSGCRRTGFPVALRRGAPADAESAKQ